MSEQRVGGTVLGGPRIGPNREPTPPSRAPAAHRRPVRPSR
ncbi:hypothetical protein SAMN05421810_1095 [Amycolatopsis arida]|uniref:Uncharacterized protein n=1 Tax=Amycolatopsis arida TaxID=587909 RepID=A0A1I5ZB27_9PSEU|nr:hypothetical protein [Amycolatopsis arida]TDX89484.1 hypothetical protein CLV69_1094 [Amycolatopsis arida]SFQ53726.1 hypothetical protein SAMN05421810_1095 [Amycolatopsis arida]